jgi:hypothetical protein
MKRNLIALALGLALAASSVLPLAAWADDDNSTWASDELAPTATAGEVPAGQVPSGEINFTP